MIGFYQIIDKLNEELLTVGFNVVTEGNIFEVDLAKQTIFPLAHIMVEPTAIPPKVYPFTFTIIGMDLVDFNKADTRELPVPLYGTSNLQDVYHDIHYKLSNLVTKFQRGDAFSEMYQVVGSPTMDPFSERFENLLAGWTLTMTIEVPAYGTIC